MSTFSAILLKYEGKLSRRGQQWEAFKRKALGLVRGIDNAFNTLVPWDSRIKRVESYFGSSVSSFFILLRWICYLNICISILIIAFVTIPG